ncbi:MAG: 6-phosphogluconolactonase [Chlamydiota bacterium]
MNENIHFFSWDDRRDIAHPGDYEATLTFCAEHFASCAKEAIKNHGFFAAALSGGSTPKAIYQKVTHPPYSDELDWSKFILFWSDERNVPPTDPKSNFWMAMEAGFKSVSIPKEQIFRMEAESQIETHAVKYEQAMRDLLGNRPFDLMMLGVGTDGHTASLFPNTTALQEKEKWVVANYIPQAKSHRMTLTYPCINRSINTVIYALGAQKQQIINDVFLKTTEPPFPASLAGTPTSKALWIIDSDAGTTLLESLPPEKIHNRSQAG